MKQIVNIGELRTSKWIRTSFRCLGLGSCLGVFLQDRLTGISGAAHIFLPNDEFSKDANFKYGNASQALQEMLLQFGMLGSNLKSLRAKIAGGASLFPSSLSTGQQNIDSVIEFLINQKIYIAAKDVGGMHSRTADFDCFTGTLYVRISQIDECRIY
jgi:chemotaxis protein CheD